MQTEEMKGDVGNHDERGRVSRVIASVLALGATVTILGCSVWSSKPKAVATLNCPADQIQVEESTAYSGDVVRGCGKADVIVQEADGKATSLRERAVFELSCRAADLEVTILSRSLYGVTGCGKRVMYKYVPNIGIMVDTTQDTGGGAAPK
jgi:hypothetical protein